MLDSHNSSLLSYSIHLSQTSLTYLQSFSPYYSDIEEERRRKIETNKNKKLIDFIVIPIYISIDTLY